MNTNRDRPLPRSAPAAEGWYIAWASLTTGKEGRGESITTCREAADAACAELNQKWPEMLHWPIRAREESE